MGGGWGEASEAQAAASRREKDASGSEGAGAFADEGLSSELGWHRPSLLGTWLRAPARRLFLFPAQSRAPGFPGPEGGADGAYARYPAPGHLLLGSGLGKQNGNKTAFSALTRPPPLLPDPFFPLAFLVNSWALGTLDDLFQSLFLCALLLFWLCVYHGVRVQVSRRLACQGGLCPSLPPSLPPCLLPSLPPSSLPASGGPPLTNLSWEPVSSLAVGRSTHTL